ncbi:hypothetical protein ACLOJK_022644 [Asimina triloba]
MWLRWDSPRGDSYCDVVEAMDVDLMSPIKRAVDAGSAGSIGETPNASKGAPVANCMSLIRSPANVGSVGSIGEMPDASDGALVANRMSLIRSTTDTRNAKSMGEMPDASEGALGAAKGVVSFTALVGCLVDVETAAHDLDNVSLASMGKFSSSRCRCCAEEKASLSDEVESPRPKEGVAKLDAGGSDGDFSVGQHGPGHLRDSSMKKAQLTLYLLRDIVAKFIEPFWELPISFSIVGPEDINFSVSICEGLEYVVKRVDAELIGFLELLQLLIEFRDCWHSILEMATLSPLLETVQEADRRLYSGVEVLRQLEEKRDAVVASFEAQIA